MIPWEPTNTGNKKAGRIERPALMVKPYGAIEIATKYRWFRPTL